MVNPECHFDGADASDPSCPHHRLALLVRDKITRKVH